MVVTGTTESDSADVTDQIELVSLSPEKHPVPTSLSKLKPFAWEALSIMGAALTESKYIN
jgi:hypothetical protein